MRLNDAKQIVKVPNNVDDVLFDNADTSDILTVIEIADEHEAKNCTVKELARRLRGANDLETCRNVWQFVKKNIKYIADKAGYERVKLANKTVHDGFGDCKSMTILEIALLRELGINAKKRFVAWDEKAEITHVYAVALVDGREVPMDAVHTRFNSEVRYAKKIDSLMKTKVALVHGLEDVKDNAPYFNYTSMTDGEMSLQILKERLKLYIAVHPDSKLVGAWKKGVQMIDNAIYKGVHGTSANLGLFGSFNPELNFVAKKLKESKKRFAPASSILLLEDRKHVGDGTDPLIQVTDPKTVCRYPDESMRASGIYDIVYRQYLDCAKKVNEENKMKEGLNRYMPTTSHHYLYEFADNRFLDNNNPLRFDTKLKIAEHKRVIPNLAGVTNLSQTNLKDWSRLSIERQHASKELGVMSPEQAIQILMQNPNEGRYDENGNKVSGPLLILAIAVLIAVAFKGIAGLIQVCRDKEPTAFNNMDGILKAGFSATGNDWASLPSGGDGGNGDVSNDCQTGFVKNAAGVCVPIENGGGSNTEGSNKWILPIAAGLVGLALIK